MKKFMILLSYFGIGILLFASGIEVFLHKKTFAFWLKFVAHTFGWLIILFVLPVSLYNGLLKPLLADGTASTIAGVLVMIYAYAAGVFICWRQFLLRQKSKAT